MINKLKKDIYKNRLTIYLIVAYLVFMQTMFSTFCPIKAIFNVNCPGCGLTHATIYMFQGQFKSAFKENYTVFLWWGFFILFFIDRYLHKFKFNIFPSVLIFVSVITLARFVLIYLFKIN